MATWIEIDRVRKDPVAFKSLAKRLLADPQYERSEFADGFLEDISNYTQRADNPPERGVTSHA
jgi:hypothetical protein